MLQVGTEQLITLTEAARLLPRRRKRRRVNVSTLYRWATKGLRGARLETVQVGGTRCTSREALDRFFASLPPSGGAGAGVAPPPPARQRAIDKAVGDLEDLGL